MGLRTFGYVLLGFMTVYAFLLSVFWADDDGKNYLRKQSARALLEGEKRLSGDCDPTRICPGRIYRDRFFATDGVVPQQSCGATADFCAVHDCAGR